MIAGLAAIILFWGVMAYIYSKTNHLPYPTLSQLAVSSKRTALIYAFGLSVSGLIFLYFLMNWFVPNLQLNPLFMTLSYIAIGLQLITAWVPFDTELNGITGLIHHYVAITEAVLLIPLLWMVANSPVLPASIRFVVYCIALVMVGFIPLGFKTQKTNRFLAVQAGYVSCFHLAVIISLLYVAIN